MSEATEERKAVKRAAAGGKVRRGRPFSKLPGLKPRVKASGAASKSAKKSEDDFYFFVYSASPTDRIGMIRQGVPAKRAKLILKDLKVEQKDFFNALGLKTATVNRKVKEKDVLSSAESERLIGFARLVGQLDAIVAESGNPEGFDSSDWMSRWLLNPLPSLGGRKPIDFLDTMEGQAIISSMIDRMQSGAYA